MNGYIYVVSKSEHAATNKDEFGKYKIGRTINPDNRFQTYGNTRIIHYLKQTDDCVKAERELIRRLKADNRVRLCEGNETFEGNLEVIINTAKSCIIDNSKSASHCQVDTKERLNKCAEELNVILSSYPKSSAIDNLQNSLDEMLGRIRRLIESGSVLHEFVSEKNIPLYQSYEECVSASSTSHNQIIYLPDNESYTVANEDIIKQMAVVAPNIIQVAGLDCMWKFAVVVDDMDAASSIHIPMIQFMKEEGHIINNSDIADIEDDGSVTVRVERQHICYKHADYLYKYHDFVDVLNTEFKKNGMPVPGTHPIAYDSKTKTARGPIDTDKLMSKESEDCKELFWMSSPITHPEPVVNPTSTTITPQVTVQNISNKGSNKQHVQQYINQHSPNDRGLQKYFDEFNKSSNTIGIKFKDFNKHVREMGYESQKTVGHYVWRKQR